MTTTPERREELERFDLTGSLPRDMAVLEASAGTGKTWTIANLVTRYVAEGLRLTELLVVSFSRAATVELRDRVRRRLVEVSEHLERVQSEPAAASDDPVVALLAGGGSRVVPERRGRLLAALREFDAATIATIHGFCQHVLGGVGLAGDVDRDARLIEDETEIVEAVVDDLLIRRFHRLGGPPVSRGDLLAIAHAVVGNPDAVIVPARSDDPATRVRTELAQAIRAEVDRRKREAGVLSYDDLLIRLAATLRHPHRGPAARRRLRAHYKVALVDEFQDTDPIQWDIMRLAFGQTGATLVLIGDPKQAIYAFRGADVYAYLQASETAASKATLGINWRSDQGLVDAHDALFGG
ncbi:MAG: UvrD-helicase domain-containing protein, partial [Actinomycetota bacterium]|nr:UvrD-helicase domain-containing protein [Actinomycetota bacterium]